MAGVYSPAMEDRGNRPSHGWSGRWRLCTAVAVVMAVFLLRHAHGPAQQTSLSAVTSAAGAGTSQKTSMSAAGAAASQPNSQPGDTVQVTLLHVNDTHGQLQPKTSPGKSTGGVARLATAVEEVRSAGGARRVFLIHCGDEFSRGNALTRRSGGAANVTLMNHLKFDFWTPGNGEFYGDLDTLQKRFAEARFPVLAANVKLRATGRLLGREYIIDRAGAVRIAFFGLCQVKDETGAGAAVEQTDPIATARELVPRLAKQADVVVAVTHIGMLEDMQLATSVAGIDVILGAHTHTVLKNGFRTQGPDGKDVLICQAGDNYRFLGRVDLSLAPQDVGYRVAEAKAQLIPLDASIRLDPTVTALLARLSGATSRRSAGAATGK